MAMSSGQRFREAANRGDVRAVQSLLNRPGRSVVDFINGKDKDGWTALHSATFNGHLDVVQLLVEKGADIEAWGEYHTSVLQIACQQGHMDVVRLLIEKGAYIDADTQVSAVRAVHVGCSCGN